MGAPTDLFAALGFVAVFAGATKTPLACTILGIELFGGEHVVHLATACFIAYRCSGRSGIYLSQRVAQPGNDGSPASPDLTVREIRQKRRSQSGDTLPPGPLAGD